MARKMKRARTEYESRGSSDDDMLVEETTPPRRSSEAQRCTSTKKKKNKGKVIKILVKLKNETSEMRKLFGNLIQSNNNQSKMLEKLIESHTYQGKNLEKLTESHNDLRKQWELHNNSPRSQWNQEPTPRYRLVFKSNVTEKIEKGQTIEIHVALVDGNNGQTVTNGPLASATVELVVIDAKFNQNDNQYNWSTEDFMSSIKKARQGNSATINEDQLSIVSNGRFNLEKGDKRHCGFTIFSNSSNKKVRLGVMVVPPAPTQERVLEGLSNPFFVRGHDRPNRTQARVDNGISEQNGPISNVQNSSCPNSTQTAGNGWAPMLGGQHQSQSQRNTPVLSTEPATCLQHQVPHWSTVAEPWNNRNGVSDGSPEQNGPTSNMHSRVWQNSTQGLDTIGQPQLHFAGNTYIPYTEPSSSQVQQTWIPQRQDHSWNNVTLQPTNNGTGMPFCTNQTAFPVHVIWDTASVMPSKHCFNLPDQLMPPHSWQRNFFNCRLPTTCLKQEHFGSLTTMPKEVMQTRRERGVLIEPIELDDSDEGRPLKRKLHSKYHLRFVNQVCETYYTWDQIKADQGNLLKVALFDENNMKITSGPLSSASVVVVALHGDFNCDGQDYWTSDDFDRSVVVPPPGKASPVIGGNCILVLAGGEACLGDAFFQTTSFCARTGKFKMGVMLASAHEERIQEGISEPFRVMDYLLAGECGRVFGRQLKEDSASINNPLVVRASMQHLLSMVKRRASSYLVDKYKVMEGMEKQQKNLEGMLLEILDVIEDAEEKGVFHDVVAASLNDLKKVAYEVNDIFDEFKNEALQREAKKGQLSMMGMEVSRDRNPIVFRYRMGKKLCKIVQTIEVLVTEMNALSFRHMQRAPASEQLMKTEHILFDSDMDVVRISRDKEKNKIIGVLLHEASNMDLTILPIVGMGGLGKTTLAKLIYNDPAIEKHFELRRWCYVSQNFDATNIANKICQTNINDQDRENALEDLLSIVSAKRYIIVLDDFWNVGEAEWGKLMTCLKHGGKGSVVLITTRDAEVARTMKMGAAEAYNIEKLSPKHLKEIVPRAFRLQKPNSDVLAAIVDICAGCPLAAKSSGFLFRPKKIQEEWKAIIDNNIWNNENSGILTSAYLSYVNLPLHMKQCLSYCALFPKDYLINAESLVQQWIALGFIPVQEDDTPETVAEEIFKELTWRSFFEEVKQTSPVEYGKRLQLRNGTMYKIHDLLYDLVQYVAGEECFTIVDKPSTKKLLPNATRHLFMSRYGISQLDDFSKEKLSVLRTLFCTDNAFSPHISECTSLRVLNLAQLEHSLEVRHFTELRYLNLSGCQEIKELPISCHNLYNLQTLDISNCTNLLQLPKDMKYMASLRHLYTNGCKSLMCMPPRLGKITSLQTLTYFVVGAGSGCSTIRELQNLNLGGELELNCLQNATEEHAKEAGLGIKEKLTHLSLRWNSEGQEEPVQHCPEDVLVALQPPCSLHMLRIDGYKGRGLPSWTINLSQFQHLTEFHLLGLVSCKEFPQFCQLKALRILYLEKLNKLQSLCSHVVYRPFPELRELRLQDLEILEKWVATEGKEELIFPVLEKIVIKNCPKLTRLAEAPNLEHIELDEGKSILLKLRGMSSLSTLVPLSTHDIEVPRPHQIDQNHDSEMSKLKLKGLPHEGRDVSHTHSSNPHKVSQGTMRGLESCFTGSSSENVDRGHGHRGMKSYEGEWSDEVPAIERITMTDAGCPTAEGRTSAAMVASEQNHNCLRGEQRRSILRVSEMLEDGWCQEISGNGVFFLK